MQRSNDPFEELALDYAERYLGREHLQRMLCRVEDPSTRADRPSEPRQNEAPPTGWLGRLFRSIA